MPDPAPPEPGAVPGAVGPPVARRLPVTRVRHGDVVVDEYEWLRDRSSPAVQEHLAAENAYTAARTAHLAGLREQIFAEIRARTQETDLSVPVRVGGHWYYGRSVAGRQYGLSCRCPAAGPDDWSPPLGHTGDPGRPLPGEEVLLDLDALAEGHGYFALGSAAVSPDGRLLAFSTDVVGDERYLLRVKDLTTGTVLPDRIPGTLGPAVWDSHGSTLFYTTVDEAWRPDTVRRHRLGTPVADDPVVFHEPDERFWVSVGRTRSDRFLVVGCASRSTTEYRLLPADRPEGTFRVVAPRRPGVEYSVEHAVIAGADRLLVLHNDGAVNFALATAPVDATSAEQWEPLLPHDPAVRLEDVDAFATHLVVSQRSEGTTQLRVVTLTADGLGEDHLVQLDEPVRTVALGDNPEFGQPTVRFVLTTLRTPPAVYDLHVPTRTRTLLRRTPVLPHPELGPFDADRYEEHRLWATADDGTAVPISLVRPAGAPRDGSVPLVLYGYGAYEEATDPYFSVPRLSLLDRGIGFAIAHVRGGGELGRPWYDAGRLLAKPNSFTDFVACARHLVRERWTAPDRLVAEGGSAGGLLVAAAADRAPDLFRGVLAEVPFVDPLTSMLDPALPLTAVEWEEWGNPLEDPEAYACLRGYSPYENVPATRYPAVLAVTSLHDTRVLYVEPAKWVARLRASVANPEEILLKVETSAGHGGVCGRYDAWRERAFSLAWLVDLVGSPGLRSPRTAGRARPGRAEA